MSTSQPRLLLVSQPSSYRIAPFLNAARRLGFKTLIASQSEFSLITEINQGLNIDLIEDSVAAKRKRGTF